MLFRSLGDAVNVSVPAGGTAMWIRVTADVDIDRWREEAAGEDVIFETGDRFSFDGSPLPYIRLGFAGHRETELAEAVRRLAVALGRVPGANARPPERRSAASLIAAC